MGLGVMLTGPLWGYAAMGVCRLAGGGALADTLSFYLMVAGWMVLPPGILILVYRLVLRSILQQRQDNVRR